MTHGRFNRRDFLRATGCLGCAFAAVAPASASEMLAVLLGDPEAASSTDPLADLVRNAPVARYWASTASTGSTSDCGACHPKGELAADAKPAHREALVRCLLCARNCTLKEGERGMCRARIHVSGQLKTLVYGRPISIHVDPIEKKPFYHFLPATPAYSLATSGCPLRCKFCQNWEISQARPEDYRVVSIPAETIVGDAHKRRAPVIAFTYNEPTVFFEYLVDIARAARERGMRSVLVSCGYMNEAPLAEMCEALDAI